MRFWCHFGTKTAGVCAVRAHGQSWSDMIGHGRGWDPHGRSWSVMVSHGRSWSVMVGHGRSWSVMVGHGRCECLIVWPKFGERV